ncbi:hypothetical protein [Nocardioides cynanchi]|uniref:hypothetical protein n=1 Tax=Nocardioides cynanchi TaxID=2558918 RepID=UPI00124923EE|nr:hypothetical protein [Nocardioides cynanchi]
MAQEQSGSPAVNEFATVLAEKPKIVFWSTVTACPDWNTTGEDVDPTVRVPELLLQPLVAGDGPPIFEPGKSYELALTGIERTGSGAAALDYAFRQVGDLTQSPPWSPPRGRWTHCWNGQSS